jgi:hypothetical protein
LIYYHAIGIKTSPKITKIGIIICILALWFVKYICKRNIMTIPARNDVKISIEASKYNKMIRYGINSKYLKNLLYSFLVNQAAAIYNKYNIINIILKFHRKSVNYSPSRKSIGRKILKIAPFWLRDSAMI